MLKRILLRSFLFAGLSLMVVSLLPQVSYSATRRPATALISPNLTEENIVFASLPEYKNQVQTSFKTADARPEIIRQYLKKYKSPLEPYSDLIVSLADQYNFDYRWLVAIAQQESNLCKRIPENSYNCWGWGIYGDKITRFDNYEHALKSIAPQFKDTFLQDEHLKDPYKVMQTYTPPSDGSWAAGVLQFFKELE